MSAQKKSKNYILTINNPSKPLLEYWDDSMKYLVGQKEKVTTEHYQAVVVFNNERHFDGVKKLFPTAHIEKVQGTIFDAIKYCTKEESRIDGPWEKGEKPKTQAEKGLAGREAEKKRWEEIKALGAVKALDEGLIPIQQYGMVRKNMELYELDMKALTFHGKRTMCFWLWGIPGSGKSRDVRTHFPDLYEKNCNKWWDGYKGQVAVLIDDFNHEQLGDLLKIWADPYPGKREGEIKGGSVKLTYKYLFVTSNNNITALWANHRPEIYEEPLRRRFIEIYYDKKFY